MVENLRRYRLEGTINLIESNLKRWVQAENTNNRVKIVKNMERGC